MSFRVYVYVSRTLHTPRLFGCLLAHTHTHILGFITRNRAFSISKRRTKFARIWFSTHTKKTPHETQREREIEKDLTGTDERGRGGGVVVEEKNSHQEAKHSFFFVFFLGSLFFFFFKGGFVCLFCFQGSCQRENRHQQQHSNTHLTWFVRCSFRVNVLPQYGHR